MTVTAQDQSKVYGGANPIFTSTETGFVLGQDASSLGGSLTYSTTAINASPVGSYSVTPGGLTSTDYAITYMPGTLAVTPAALTITAEDQSKVYGAALPTLTASYFGFVNDDSPASLSAAPILTTDATAASHVVGNPYSITASAAADPNYAITYMPGNLTVTPAPLTITAADQSKIYGAALPTLTASYTGFVNDDSTRPACRPPRP